MEQIELVPLLDARKFTAEVATEMDVYEVSTHDHGDIIYIEWDGFESYPETQEWLLKTYGSSIEKYKKFAIDPT